MGTINSNVFGWNGNGQYYEFIDTFQPGKAFWLYAYAGCIIFSN